MEFHEAESTRDTRVVGQGEVSHRSGATGRRQGRQQGSLIRSKRIDPLERIFLLNLYIRKYSFDLNDYLENLSTAKNEMSIAGYFRNMEKKEHPDTPYFRDVFKLTLYGSSNQI